MKNRKIILIIAAVLMIAAAAFAGCSKDGEAGKDGSKSKPGKNTSTTMSVKELETATNPDGTPVVKDGMEIVTNSNGTAVTNADGTVVTKPKGAPDESTTKKETTTMSKQDEKKLMDDVARKVNGYIEASGMDVDYNLTKENNEHHAVITSPAELKSGSALDECKQIVDFVLTIQKEKPEIALFEVKAMHCYYEKNTFYIVFSPNALEEDAPTEAPAEE